MKYEILTPNGWSDFTGIKRKPTTELCNIVTESGKNLECTLDHQIMTIKGWVEAQNININDLIITNDGDESVVINQIKNTSILTNVYDLLEVSKDHQYFTNGLISHNCEFQGSSGTLITGSKLKSLVTKIPLLDKNSIKMYENAIPEHMYVCVADVSRGKGLDYSAFQIIDVTEMPYKQVCIFRDNLITPLDYAEVIFRTCKGYNEASILVEINDIGQQVIESILYDFEYENVLYTTNNGRSGKMISTGGKSQELGIRTTRSVKSVGCSVLKLLVEQDQLLVNDFDTIKELSTFSKKANSFEAESGCHDDMVMCLVLFAWLSDQKYFREITDINTLAKLRERTNDDLDAEMLPFGFHETGHDEPLIIDVVEDRWLHF